MGLGAANKDPSPWKKIKQETAFMLYQKIKKGPYPTGRKGQTQKNINEVMKAVKHDSKDLKTKDLKELCTNLGITDERKKLRAVLMWAFNDAKEHHKYGVQQR